MSELLQKKEQFKLIQALRGLAALWVVLFHAYQGLYITGLTDRLPTIARAVIFEYGSAGVAIFFVLSGFVIAHSLEGRPMNGGYLAHFAFRRSIRLDPPYWVAILLSIAVSAIMAKVHQEPITLPSVATIGWHLLYLQEIVGAPEINLVFWTLCFEFQFYLFFAAAMCLTTTFASAQIKGLSGKTVIFHMMTVLAIASALLKPGWVPHGLFVELWHGFFLGVLAYHAGYLRKSPAPFLILAAATLAGAQSKTGLFGTPATLTALGLFVASRTSFLVDGLRYPPLQFLGKVSYSLYLIHVPLIIIGFGGWGRFVGRGLVQDSFGLIIILVALIISTWLFWRLFEYPSHKLASARAGKDRSSTMSVDRVSQPK